MNRERLIIVGITGKEKKKPKKQRKLLIFERHAKWRVTQSERIKVKKVTTSPQSMCDCTKRQA